MTKRARREPDAVERYGSKHGVQAARKRWTEKYGSRVTFGLLDNGYTLTVFVNQPHTARELATMQRETDAVVAEVTRLTTERTNELVEAVRAHARRNYNTGGWDWIVECYEDDTIADVITTANARTVDEAINAFRDIVAYYREGEADARNSAF